MMRRTLSLTTAAVLSVAVITCVAITAAYAATPFGGDDSGFVPPGGTKKGTVGACEIKESKILAHFIACGMKCHDDRAAGKLVDDTAEEACEETNVKGTGCADKYVKAIDKLTGCPACFDPVTPAVIWEDEGLDGFYSPTIYCDSTSGIPFGGDDGGFVPVAKSTVAKCEKKVSKLNAMLIACTMNCHRLRASGKLADDTAEEACEETNVKGKGCRDKYNKAVAKLTGCPPCLDGSAVANLAESSTDAPDALDGLIYCASPSGAFVDGIAGF